MPQVHRVKRGPRPVIVELPRDAWRSPSTYVEGDGTEMDVVWNGARGCPPLCASIDRGTATRDVPARLHLRRPS